MARRAVNRRDWLSGALEKSSHLAPLMALGACETPAEQRFPLDRVSRVIAGARMSWSDQAMQACLEDAIPVVIVSEDGSPLGSLQPTRVRIASLAAALEELLDRPDWRTIYDCWLRAARMRVLTDWRRAREAEGAAPEPDTCREVKQYIYRHAPSPANATTPLWRAALYGLATQAIGRWGVPVVVWAVLPDP